MKRSTYIRVAFAVLAIGFFAAPILLRGVGVTATAFENRRLADAPQLSQGWDGFQQTSRFLTDRLPLREQAVRANTKLWQTFFGTTPRYGAPGAGGALTFAGKAQGTAGKGGPKPGGQAVQVLAGRDGWLFLEGELERACTPMVPLPVVLERWRRLVSIVRASGRRAVVMVPPDKGSIYGEHLPDGDLTDCARRGKPRFWDLLAREPRRSGIVELESALAARKRRGGQPLYSKKDSHWTGPGSLEMVRAVLDRLGAGVKLKRGEVVRLPQQSYAGDLTLLRGESGKDTRPARAIRRAANARRVPGRTLFVRDSFGDRVLPFLRLYFADLRRSTWVVSPAQLLRSIEEADTVIFESVEREFAFRASEQGPLGKNFLERLRRRLGSR
jgi:hypothetical protein